MQNKSRFLSREFDFKRILKIALILVIVFLIALVFGFYYVSNTLKKIEDGVKSRLNNRSEEKLIQNLEQQVPSNLQQESDSTYTYDESIPAPIIYTVEPSRASIGSQITVRGENLQGFEGDINIWLENTSGEKGIIYGNGNLSNENIIIAGLPEKICQEDKSYVGTPCENWMKLIPGNYKLYVHPWDRTSNRVNLTIE